MTTKLGTAPRFISQKKLARDGAHLALLREILSPAAAGPSRTSREAEGGNGAAPAARGEDLP